MPQKLPAIKPSSRFLLTHGLISLLLLSATLLVTGNSNGSSREMVRAVEIMDSSLRTISGYCRSNRINTDTVSDPRTTGLIGPEFSEIATTAGDLEAKRTTINPQFGALVVRLLTEAGVRPGDTIAIGCSGSFPALMIASMAAAKALKLHPRVILSLGSSSWGASNPDFTIWHIWKVLQEKGIIESNPDAVSLGGDYDTGSGFEGDIAARLTAEITKSGITLINNPVLTENIRIRNSIYFNGKPGSVKAFISTGGSYSSMGTSVEILKVKPGLVRKARMPEPEQQGMIHSMLGQGIPVIHLLYIKGLAQQYNLPWNPATSRPRAIFHLSSFIFLSPFAFYLSPFFLLYFIFILIRFRLLHNRE